MIWWECHSMDMKTKWLTAHELTLFLMNFSALLSLDTFSSSMALLSYGAKPHTSLIMSRTNLLCLVRRCTETVNSTLEFWSSCMNETFLSTMTKTQMKKNHSEGKNCIFLRTVVPNTYPTATTVLWSCHVLGDWMAFTQAHSHGVSDSHVCKEQPCKCQHLYISQEHFYNSHAILN